MSASSAWIRHEQALVHERVLEALAMGLPVVGTNSAYCTSTVRILSQAGPQSVIAVET